MKLLNDTLVPLDLLESARIRLAPLTPDSYEFLYWLACAGQNSARWRYRMQVPPFEVFVQQVHQDVLAQFVVCDVSSGEPIGHVVCYSADSRSGIAYVAGVMAPDRVGSGIGREALDVFVDYIEMVWPLRKLYAEVPDFTFQHFDTAGHEFRERPARTWAHEATLTDHVYCSGRYWDMHIASVALRPHSPDAG